MAHLPNKALIWDLGNTLLRPDPFCFAREIGIANFLLYMLLDRENPTKIHEPVFELLHKVDKPHPAHPEATYPAHKSKEKVLPPLMCHWLAGTIQYEEILQELKPHLQEWSEKGKFSSKRQEQLVKKTLEIIFDPLKIARCMKIIPEGLSLLKECFSQYDKNRKQRHSFYILSNWDPYSFTELYTSRAQELFNYFDPDNIIISGTVGLLKPQSGFYTHILEKYNLEPESCILIDDQSSNIHAAEKIGMTGLLIKNGNYRPIRKRLQDLMVI